MLYIDLSLISAKANIPGSNNILNNDIKHSFDVYGKACHDAIKISGIWTSYSRGCKRDKLTGD